MLHVVPAHPGLVRRVACTGMTVTSNVDAKRMGDQISVDDWRALGDLVALATDRLSAPAEGIHQAIADRWFGVGGHAESLTHSSNRWLIRSIYGTVRGAGSIASAAIAVGAATIGDTRTVRPLWKSRRGAGIQAATNALWGDEFARQQSHMHTELGIRDPDGAPVSTDAISLNQAYCAPTHRLVVLLHGLGHTERCWQGRIDDDGAPIGITHALEADGFTPVFVRYNTGMRVSHNRERLSQLLDDIVDNWPAPVHEIALIGHSMGALIARGAVHTGKSAGSTWITRVRHVVSIAAPHHGSPIEKGVHCASRILDRTAEGRPLSAFIDERSAGIKDMRFGTVQDVDQDEVVDKAQTEVSIRPLGDGINHHLVAGIVTANSRNLFGLMVGDLVVRLGSATGAGSRTKVEAANVQVFTGRTHPGLLKDPAVHSQVRAWLTPSSVESDVVS